MASSAKDKKVALVTGASSGIGKVIATRLLKDGLAVVAAARSIDKMHDLKELGAHVIALDVSDEEGVIGAMARISSCACCSAPRAASCFEPRTRACRF